MRIDEFMVVWNGELDRKGLCPTLLPERASKPTQFWLPWPRLYNKKSDFWLNRRGTQIKLDNPIEDVDDLEILAGPEPEMEAENGEPGEAMVLRDSGEGGELERGSGSRESRGSGKGSRGSYP